MFKAELFRLVKSKTMWAVTIVAIAAVFAVSVYYNNNLATCDNYIYSQITEYSSVEEIPENIAIFEKILKNEDDEDEKSYYEQVILIYNYLYENQIDYDELTENYASALGRLYYSDDAVSFSEFMIEKCAYIIFAAMIICAAVLIASDFGGNMYKTVFGTNKSRIVILCGRFFVYLIYLAILFAFSVFIILVTSLQYGLPFKYIICSVSGNVFTISPVTYIIIIFMLWAVFLFEYAAAIFGISACFKNIFAALAFPAVYYGSIAMLSGASSLFGDKIYTLNNTFDLLFCGLYPLWCYITAFIVKLLLAAIFLAIGTAIYNKRQL